MEVEIRPTPDVQRQAARSRVRRGPAAWLDLDPNADRAGEHDRGSDQLPAPGRRVVAQIGPRTQRQRVGDREHTARASQLGDEDGSVGLVPLAGLDHVLGGDDERAALTVVEQAAEQRLGIEARQA